VVKKSKKDAGKNKKLEKVLGKDSEEKFQEVFDEESEEELKVECGKTAKTSIKASLSSSAEYDKFYKEDKLEVLIRETIHEMVNEAAPPPLEAAWEDLKKRLGKRYGSLKAFENTAKRNIWHKKLTFMGYIFSGWRAVLPRAAAVLLGIAFLTGVFSMVLPVQAKNIGRYILTRLEVPLGDDLKNIQVGFAPEIKKEDIESGKIPPPPPGNVAGLTSKSDAGIATENYQALEGRIGEAEERPLSVQNGGSGAGENIQAEGEAQGKEVSESGESLADSCAVEDGSAQIAKRQASARDEENMETHGNQLAMSQGAEVKVREVKMPEEQEVTLQEVGRSAPFRVKIPSYLPERFVLEHVFLQKLPSGLTAKVTMEYKETGGVEGEDTVEVSGEDAADKSSEQPREEPSSKTSEELSEKSRLESSEKLSDSTRYLCIEQKNITGSFASSHGYDAENATASEVDINGSRGTLIEFKRGFVSLFWIDEKNKIVVHMHGKISAREALKVARSMDRE